MFYVFLQFHKIALNCILLLPLRVLNSRQLPKAVDGCFYQISSNLRQCSRAAGNGLQPHRSRILLSKSNSAITLRKYFIPKHPSVVNWGIFLAYCNLKLTGRTNLARTTSPSCLPGTHAGISLITRAASASRRSRTAGPSRPQYVSGRSPERR